MAEPSSSERFDLWNQFTQRWPIEKLQTLTLEEYNSLGSKDSFCYWLEKRTESLGSIWGGSSFKFGIFEFNPAANAKEESDVFRQDAKYKWLSKYGDSAAAAFEEIKKIIISVAQAAREEKFSEIDDADLGHATKWKIAFLYQPKNDVKLPCVYRLDWLRAYASCHDSKIPSSQLYSMICEKKDPETDIFAFSDSIWQKVKAPSAWLIAAGEGAYLWDDFLKSNMIKIGWGDVGNLDSLPDINALKAKVKETSSDYGEKSPDKAAGMLWSFAHDIRVGDTVFVKSGTSRIIGCGTVKSDYIFGDFGKYRHARKVEWTQKGTWAAPFKCPQWTLTRLSSEKSRQLEELVSRGDSDPNNPEPTKTKNMNMKRNKWGIPLALNTIFYGPPGTGKTHSLLEEYAKPYFCSASKPMTPEERNMEIVSDLGWWEVIALVLLDLNAPTKVPEILKHSLLKAKIIQSASKNPNCAIWGQLQIHTKDECETVNVAKERRAEPKVFSKRDDSTWEIDQTLLKELRPDLIQCLKEFQTPPRIQEVKRYEFITFHQSFSYENFVEGIKAQTDEDSGELQYVVEPGIFQKTCNIARQNPEEPYALFIDEINRGNVSGIFGELISLIEENKREGGAEELKTILPYSRKSFSVPANLFIIGSMNTADRSIDALDSALRRRFSFVEMAPRPELLSEAEWKPRFLSVDLADLLESLNRRVEFLLDRDHRIGHSYFMKIRGESKEAELENLQTVFRDQIIPLLEDYFYGNLEKVAMILGPGFIEKTDCLTGDCLLETDDIADLPEKTIRKVADLSKLTEDDFESLIKK